MKTHVEGEISLFISQSQKISKKLPVFYNPVMEFQRDITLLLLKCWDKQSLKIADPLAGSGVRSLRMLKELSSTKIESILINDINKNAVDLIKTLFLKNNISTEKVKILNQDANRALLEGDYFDFIDIDPFGSPNSFLDSSVKKIANKGILAVTATDVAALAGTYPKACLRKYLAMPLRNELMHEIGLRILIRKIQLIGAQYDKSLMPIFSHSTNHYLRVFFLLGKGKQNVDEALQQHKFFHFCKICSKREISLSNDKSCCEARTISAGPIWTGQLWDDKLVSKMLKTTAKHIKFLEIIKEEAEISEVGFYHLHKLSKLLKKQPPKKEIIINNILKRKYKAGRTHFTPEAIKTDMPVEELKKLF